jgi:hypothetical protein
MFVTEADLVNTDVSCRVGNDCDVGVSPLVHVITDEFDASRWIKRGLWREQHAVSFHKYPLAF